MYFKLNASQEDYLLKQPETGMGYQIVESSKSGSYSREKFLILNSEVVIEMNKYTNDNVRMVLNKGTDSIKTKAGLVTLTAISVFNPPSLKLRRTRRPGLIPWCLLRFLSPELALGFIPFN